VPRVRKAPLAQLVQLVHKGRKGHPGEGLTQYRAALLQWYPRPTPREAAPPV